MKKYLFVLFTLLLMVSCFSKEPANRQQPGGTDPQFETVQGEPQSHKGPDQTSKQLIPQENEEPVILEKSEKKKEKPHRFIDVFISVMLAIFSNVRFIP